MFGRFSVLLVNGFIGFALFGINVLFVLFFEQITITFFIDKNEENYSHAFFYKTVIIIGLCLLMLPVSLKR